MQTSTVTVLMSPPIHPDRVAKPEPKQAVIFSGWPGRAGNRLVCGVEDSTLTTTMVVYYAATKLASWGRAT